ncbi:MAG: sulfite exporter TauE/SafE family protein [Candidatus Competibacteraceae bacterium]|nr:sulfite exporter TauE/SafE family protein [Candidatus Competibacteraceae bacterium]
MLESAHLLSAWLLGLSLGLTACTATCLPFMGTWVLARERGAVLADTGLFLVGRVSAYTLLGLIAALSSARLIAVLQNGVGHLAIGAAAIGAGSWLLLAEQRPRACATSHSAGAPPFALGFALSLTPCAPLASLLAFAAQSDSGWFGALQGLAFGLGAAVTPLLLLLPLLSALGARLRAEQRWLGLWLRRGVALSLFVLGMYRFWLGTI